MSRLVWSHRPRLSRPPPPPPVPAPRLPLDFDSFLCSTAGERRRRSERRREGNVLEEGTLSSRAVASSRQCSDTPQPSDRRLDFLSSSTVCPPHPPPGQSVYSAWHCFPCARFQGVGGGRGVNAGMGGICTFTRGHWETPPREKTSSGLSCQAARPLLIKTCPPTPPDTPRTHTLPQVGSVRCPPGQTDATPADPPPAPESGSRWV